MSQDPRASFDQTVLELIEQSPVGVAPHTPTYADTVQRLLGAQKIYRSADHKDGYVTVRSLSRLASFHAANWESFVSGKIGDELLEPNSSVFNRYVASLASERQKHAEAFRERAAGKPVMHRARHGAVFHDPIHALFLVPGSGPNGALPGNYLHGALIQLGPDPRNSAWAVDVHDADDSVVLFDAANLAEASTKLQEVLESAPFFLWELEDLGFRRKA
jgi:hypothetical protein